MRVLKALSLYALVVSSLPACFAVRVVPGDVSLSWSILDTSTNQQVSCVTGDTVVVNIGGYADSFNCLAGSGIVYNIPPGTYSMRVDLVNISGGVDGTQSLTVSVFSGGLSAVGNVVLPVQSAAPLGSAAFSWTIELTTGDAALCNPNEAVEITLSGTPYLFDCEAYAATVPNLPAGTYSVTARLLSDTNAVLSETGAPVSIAVTDGSTSPTQPFIFVVN